MPQKRSAYKELRKGKKRHARNIAALSKTKTLVKQFNALLSENKLEEAKKFLGKVSSAFSKATSKNIIHKNTASRRVARLSKRLHKAGSKK